MAKVIVEKGLAEAIKSLRTQNGVASKDLADALGKSKSYVSKLEAGKIRTIDSEELIKCFKFISKEEELDEILEQVFKSVSIKYSRKEIEQMLWLDNFDTVYRRIPIPAGFAETYKKRLDESGITYETLTEEINKNLFIPEGEKQLKSIPDNEWFQAGKNTYIKMKVFPEQVESLLTGKCKKTNYVFLLAIVLYYLRLTEYKEVESFEPELTREISKRAQTILEEYKVYTLSRKSEIVEKAVNSQELLDRLSSHEKENANVIGQFNPLLHLYSYYDVEAANRLIREFTDNMTWDAPFIMEIAGLPFYKLENCSFRLKKKLLNKIRELLNESLKLPEPEKRREEY